MKILLARVYMMESEHHINQVINILRDKIKISHVTLFRGVEGFEKGGKVHSFHIMSLSLDLPLAIEFFDTSDQVSRAVDAIKKVLDKGHIVTFPAQLHLTHGE